MIDMRKKYFGLSLFDFSTGYWRGSLKEEKKRRKNIRKFHFNLQTHTWEQFSKIKQKKNIYFHRKENISLSQWPNSPHFIVIAVVVFNERMWFVSMHFRNSLSHTWNRILIKMPSNYIHRNVSRLSNSFWNCVI